MQRHAYTILTYLIAAVWLINGLYCKVLNQVPRHQQIVARILGDEFAPLLTRAIGISEIAMAIWIVSRLYPRLNALTQIAIVATMNAIEFARAPDLLLWGRFNSLWAAVFILVVYYHQFVLNKREIASV